MQVVALDLDRVLFDTNRYFVLLRKRLSDVNLDFDEVAKKSANLGRKDLTTMVKVVSEEVGMEVAENLFFKKVKQFWKGGVAEIFNSLREKFDKIFVVTVGDGYQSRKISGLDVDNIFVVDSDDRKIQVVCALHEKYPNLIFVDDKLSVVKALSKKGIRSYQALWFLDEAHKKEKFDKHLNKARELLGL